MENIIKEFHARINGIAYNGNPTLETLAAKMDTSVSELSRRLGNDSLPLRFSDCIKIMILKDDYSPLDIILDKGGYYRQVQEKSPTELIDSLIEAINELPDRLREAAEAFK